VVSGFYIAFAFSADLTLYAGYVGKDNARGYAAQRESAIKFGDRESAERTLANGYGQSMQEIGVVVEA
jgi:hypothetical protein